MNENEEKCLSAAIEFLGQGLTVRASNIWFPEDVKDFPRDQRIECAFQIGDRDFAVEHTLVEPYEKFTSYQESTKNLYYEFLGQIGNNAPIVGIDILLPNNWPDSVRGRKNISKFAAYLTKIMAEWCQDFEKWEDNDRPVEVGRFQDIPILCVRNGFEHFEPVDTQPYISLLSEMKGEDRNERVSRALTEKLPKLTKWTDKAKTILILENRDLSLTNFRSIYEIVYFEFSKLIEPPIDYLFYISTAHATWNFYPFIQEKSWTTYLSNGLPNVVRYPHEKLALPIG